MRLLSCSRGKEIDDGTIVLLSTVRSRGINLDCAPVLVLYALRFARRIQAKSEGMSRMFPLLIVEHSSVNLFNNDTFRVCNFNLINAHL